MKRRVTLDTVYKVSEDIVVREIKGKIVIIPFASGISDEENELYTLNPTGQAVWQRLDGTRSLKDVVAELTAEFEFPVRKIEKDVVGIVEKLLKKGLLVEAREI